MLAHDLLFGLAPAAFMRSLDVEPDSWQEQILCWSGQQAILNCSRQSGKSTVASLLALHRAFFFPNSLVLLVSPSLRQSSELFAKVRSWLERMPSKPEMAEDNRLSLVFTNSSRIISLPGNEATVRGFSAASLVILDEAARVDDTLYYSLRPMLATSGGRLLLMSTPYGKRGFFYEEWTIGSNWTRISIPATACPRIPSDFLESERRSLGPRWFAQEYLCSFEDTVDQVFDTDLVRRLITPNIEPLFEVKHVLRRS